MMADLKESVSKESVVAETFDFVALKKELAEIHQDFNDMTDALINMVTQYLGLENTVNK